MTVERCRQLWEQRYPNVRKPDTYFREWVAERMVGARRALDAGCGAGGTVDYTAAPGVFGVGVDISFDAVKQNKNAHARVVASLDALPFLDGVFDVVASEYVIEHLKYPEECFDEISRVSGPKASYVFLTTNATGYIGLLVRMMPQGLQRWIKMRFLKMREEQVLPVYLLCNTRGRLTKGMREAGYPATDFIFVGGPFYFQFSYILFRLAMFLERLTDGGWKHLKFYIVGRAVKKT